MFNRKISSITLIVLVLVSLLPVVVVPLSAQPRVPGVAEGDWFKYGEFCGQWHSNDPGPTNPYLRNMIDYYNAIQWISMSIESVSGTIVNVHFTYHFKNQTETSLDTYVNVDSGEGNATVWILSADLGENSSLYTSGPLRGWKINETIARAYPCGDRDTNHMNGTVEQFGAGYYYWVCINYYWDKSTGVFVEFSYEGLNQTAEYLTTYSISFRIVESNVWEVSNRGPRTDSLYIKYFNGSSALYDALKNGEVDITNIGLNQTQIDEVFGNSNIQAAISPSSMIFQFDFNNNDTTPTYPDYKNPTAYKEFRQGIACLVRKDYIVNNICNYSCRIDTPISRPLNDWWVDWNVSQYDSYGDSLGNYPYEYDPDSAAYYFDLSGFVEGENTINPYYDEYFPSSAHYLRIDPSTNEDMDPLIFYIRNDDPRRLEAGILLTNYLRKMGIPVNAILASRSTCVNEVMMEGDYHIYTGGWSFSSAYEGLLIYTSEYITEGWMTNYPQFRNATYDHLAKILQSPSSLTEAKEAALLCQEILVKEAVCVWLYCPSQVRGYRNVYGVVNLPGGGIDNEWTFLNARLGINATRTAIYYGLQSPPESLNVITDYWPESLRVNVVVPSIDCLGRIYDTLLSYCPYDKTPGNVFEEGNRGGTMPWLAEEWDLGRWQSPYNPAENLTKLTFYLRDGVKWHDGYALDSADVKFTIEYIKNLGTASSLYDLVSNVHHVITPNARTVIVYENVSNIWTLDLIGNLPILPKHIFQNIANVTGYTPGANEGHPANQTLIGSGPWKYVFHNSSMLQLEANREYFMETPPKAEIDFRYDWEMGSFVVDSMDVSMVGRAYGSSGNGIPDTNWEPGCDISRGDCHVDFSDVLAAGAELNVTWGKSAKRYVVQPPTDTTIYVEPSNTTILVGETLTAYVTLDNFVHLSGLQLKLNYDNTILKCLNMSLDTEMFGSCYEVKNEINQTEGFVWISVSSLGSSASGDTILATIHFNATKSGSSALDLWNTKLASYGPQGLTCQLMSHNAIDHGVIIGVRTPTGKNITVAPAENAKLTFDNINTEGVTTLNITQPPSTEFVSVLCNEIKTTANYTGNITIQFAYDPTGLSLEDEKSMKIWFWNITSQTWVDITTYVDTANNIVYGVTSHLSIYGVTGDLSIEADFSESGEITAKSVNPPSDLPGLMLMKCYDIQTTKTYIGNLILRLKYDEKAVTPEEEGFVQIWGWNSSLATWVDITTHVDPASNIVYGETPHLSIYGVTGLKSLPPEIAVIGATFSKTVVSQGFNFSMNFTIKNQGGFAQTFDVFVYRNSTIIAIYTANNLAHNAEITLSYTWSTAGWAKGNYSISVCDKAMKWVFVAIRGDVNGNRKVDLDDVLAVALAYGSNRRSGGQYLHQKPCQCCPHSPNCDIDGDGKIDLTDYLWAAINFGKVGP